MVYSDVVSGGLLLPKKSRYTKRDFEKLVNNGTSPKLARFICLCSAVHYDVPYSKFFDNHDLKVACKLL